MSIFSEIQGSLSEVKQGIGSAIEKGREASNPGKVLSGEVKDINKSLQPLPGSLDNAHAAATAMSGLLREGFIDAAVAGEKLAFAIDDFPNPIAQLAIQHAVQGSYALEQAGSELDALRADIAFLQERMPEILERAASAKEHLTNTKLNLAFAFGVNKAVDFLADRIVRDPDGPTLNLLPKAINEINQFEQTL